jgi:large subunit ribosomal protein L16
MSVPSLTNSKYKLFQWKSKRFSGIAHKTFLPTNVFFCKSYTNYYFSSCHLDLIAWYIKWKLKKSGAIVFPTSQNFPITKKPTEVRMGKGKGSIVDWTIPVWKGSIPFFFLGKKTPTVLNTLLDIGKKLPIRSKIVESKHKFVQLSAKSIFFYSEEHFLPKQLLKKSFFY